MKKLIVTFIFLLCLYPLNLFAFDANLEAEWTWDGTDQTIEGFKFYLDDTVVFTVNDPSSRKANWVYDLINGSHNFSMTAFGTDDDGSWESLHSPTYRLEYLYVPSNDRPAPTVYIRIN